MRMVQARERRYMNVCAYIFEREGEREGESDKNDFKKYKKVI